MKRRGARRALAASALALSLAAGCSAISGLGGFHFDESSSGGSGGATGGGAGGTTSSGGGECDQASDCNPRACLVASCQDHHCLFSPTPAESACESGVCDGHGSCVECVNAGDCPAASECQVRACVSRACTVSTAMMGTPCGVGDSLFCDGSGKCVGCLHDSDCGANRNCDANQICQDLCSDGVKNYDEIDVDCGGSCPTCADGKLCMSATDCTSGHCVDGVCCDIACAGACQACNLGSGGVCQALPQDTEDPGICDATHGTCGAACACGQTGLCLVADFSPCSQGSDCASGSCGAGGKCKP